MYINFKAYLKNLITPLIIILLTLEISPFIIGSFFLNEGYDRKQILDEIRQHAGSDSTIQPSEASGGYLSEHILHPYLGFIHQPDGYYNNYGFPGNNPVVHKSEQRINICLMGGSVAKQLYQQSGDRLVELLQQQEAYKGKEIQLVLAALGGYKQPQQLLVLNYLLSLGAHFDLVINLDGFNELVLPLADNLPFNIHWSYPRHWNVYARKGLDKSTSMLLGKQSYLLEKLENRRQGFSSSVFRYSNFGLFLWKIREQELSIQIQQNEQLMRTSLESQDNTAQVAGPPFALTDTSAYLVQQADYWAHCSALIHDLSVQKGFKYFHFLQPNQYVEGSKTLTEEEVRIAFEDGDFSYKRAVRLGYPHLIKQGEVLKNKGVVFHDLTQLFSQESETVYRDKCCHFNKKGYDALAKEIARAIHSNYSSETN